MHQKLFCILDASILFSMTIKSGPYQLYVQKMHSFTFILSKGLSFLKTFHYHLFKGRLNKKRKKLKIVNFKRIRK